MKKLLFKAALVGAASLSCGLISLQPAAAAKKTVAPDKYYGREPWPAQRVVLLLPLQFGPGWNLDKEKAAYILPDAEQKLQQALQRTGKFSTMQVHRYNPVLLRAVQDKVLTKEQAKSIVAAPTVANVQDVLGKMAFDQPPLIAEFSMEEITTEAGAPIPFVRAQVTGKLYEANNPEAIKTVVVTSDPQPLYYARKQKGKTVYVRRSSGDRILAAADNAFGQIAREFIEPLEDITLPEPPVANPVTGTVQPGAAITPVTPGAGPVIKVPQGQVLGTFSVPKK